MVESIKKQDGAILKKDMLKVIIREFHESDLPDLITRHLSVDLSAIRSPLNKVITISGPRRAGKTSFLFQIIKFLLSKGMDIEDIVYVNFEDERILPLKSTELHGILDAYFELYEGKTAPLLFFDEIQNITGWDTFVRRLNDQGHRIFITGSNSKLLSSEIARVLRGRTLTYELFPFSFSEYICSKGILPEKTAIFGKKRHEIRRQFETYFFSGGYPEISFIETNSTKTRILQDYFNAIFYRDLIERYRIRNIDLLRQWLNTLMANISCLVSHKKVENDYKSRGIKLSRATLSTFARYVEDVYFGFFVEIYSESERKRQVNPKKFYLVDQGLHNHLTLKFAQNTGRLLENLVFLNLRRKGYPVWYYKTKGGYEVDFLYKKGGEKHLIQVCHDLSNIETVNREKRALLSGMRELEISTGMILTSEEKKEEMLNGLSVVIMPVWEWLLVSDF